MAPLLRSVVEAMEASPLVALDRLTKAAGVEGRILAKLDYLLPGFSKKDRAARRIIEDARTSGELRPGQTVVELTSGKMGTGLAIVCAVLGHPFVAVMSAGNSPERARMMRALGAEVVLVPQTEGATPGKVSGADLDLVEVEAQRLTRARNAFRADQFEREGNRRAYRDGTGAEILRQSGGTVTAFCDFVGTGGSLAGCAAAFAAAGANIRCYAAEPEGAEAIAGGDVSRPDHPIQGGGYSRSALTHLTRSRSRRDRGRLGQGRAGDRAPACPHGRNFRRLFRWRECRRRARPSAGARKGRGRRCHHSRFRAENI